MLGTTIIKHRVDDRLIVLSTVLTIRRFVISFFTARRLLLLFVLRFYRPRRVQRTFKILIIKLFRSFELLCRTGYLICFKSRSTFNKSEPWQATENLLPRKIIPVKINKSNYKQFFKKTLKSSMKRNFGTSDGMFPRAFIVADCRPFVTRVK